MIASRACPPPERCEPSDWSPDGRTLILTVRTAQGTDVWTMPVEPTGGADVARPVFGERFNERDARISPDGESIAYVSDETGREEVSVRRMSGGERTVLSPGGGHQPVWRRDGAELFYVDPQGTLRAVAVRRGSGGTLVPGAPVPLGVSPDRCGPLGHAVRCSRATAAACTTWIVSNRSRQLESKSSWAGPLSCADIPAERTRYRVDRFAR